MTFDINRIKANYTVRSLARKTEDKRKLLNRFNHQPSLCVNDNTLLSENNSLRK